MTSPKAQDASLRDNLALTRTRLANERTLLAYLRTGIMLSATGATAIKLFPGEPLMHATGWGLVGCAAVVAAVGGWRFRRVESLLH